MATATKTPEELKDSERAFVEEIWNGRNYDHIDEMVATDYVGHWFDPERGDVDRDGLRAFIEDVHEGFSDFRMDVEFLVAEDGMVTEGWAVWDALGQLQELGVVPESFTLSAFLETGANLAKQDVLQRTKTR